MVGGAHRHLPNQTHPNMTVRVMQEGPWLCLRLGGCCRAAWSGSLDRPGLVGDTGRPSFSVGLVWHNAQGSSQLHVHPTRTECLLRARHSSRLRDTQVDRTERVPSSLQLAL